MWLPQHTVRASPPSRHWVQPSQFLLFAMKQFAASMVAVAAMLAAAAAARSVTLSNTQLPADQTGALLRTGEGDVLFHDGAYYFYFNK